jgi:hypothetical protein
MDPEFGSSRASDPVKGSRPQEGFLAHPMAAETVPRNRLVSMPEATIYVGLLAIGHVEAGHARGKVIITV